MTPKTKKISLLAHKRSEKDKPKALKRQGLVPAVVYGPKTKPISVAVSANDALKAYQEAGTSHLIDLKLGKKTRKVLIYDVQFDPITDAIIHMDFYAVRMDQPIRAEIPLEFVGEAPAVKDKGGVLLTEKDSVEVECLPQDLIDEIKVDLGALKEIHDAIKVEDLEVPKTIKILDDKEVVVATVQPPRSEEELAELEETPVEDVEAVEVEKGKEEEEAEEEGEEKPTEEESSKTQETKEESNQ